MLHAFSLLLLLFLGEERPLAPLSYEPAHATHAATASNGLGQLVAWRPLDREAIYVQLIDEQSLALRTPEGILLGRAETGVVRLGGAATDGDGYVVSWGDGRKVWVTHVTAAGAVSPPRLLAELGATLGVEPRSIASNGSGYLATWLEHTANSARVYGRMLDVSGTPVGQPFALAGEGARVRRDFLVSNGSGYLAILDVGEQRPAAFTFTDRVVPIGPDGAVGSARQVDAAHVVMGAAFDGSSYVLASSRIVGNEQIIETAAVTANGEIGTWREVSRGFSNPFSSVALASNGNGSLLMLQSGAPRAIRLAPGGMPLDAAPRPLPITTLRTPLLLSNGPQNRYFVAGTFPLAGGWIPANLDVEILVNAQPIVLAPVAQSRPRAVPVGGSHVVTHHERMVLRVNGTIAATNTNASALASDGTRALVVWADGAIRGRFIDAAGRMSDPFLIVPNQGGVAGAVAVDGGFGVMWQSPDAIRYVRVGDSNPRRFELPVYAGATTQHQTPVLVRTAAGFLVVYTELVFPSRTAIRAMAFHADGSPAGPLRTITDSLETESNPHVATDGAGRLLAVWSSLPLSGGSHEIRAVPLDEDGRIAGEERILGAGTQPRASWTGSEFAVVSGAMLGAVSRDGEIVQPLAPFPGAVYETTIGGRAIAYVRDDQVRVRTLEQLRRRAAR